MKTNWILTASGAGVLAGIVTYLLTGSWQLALIGGGIALVLVLLNNPVRRYINAFYVVMLPLLSNFYFKFNLKKEDVALEAGIDELATVPNIILGLMALTCLALDYLERNGKLEWTFLSVKKNRVGDINGNNNQINQTNV